MRPWKGHTELLATVTSDQIWGSPGGLQDVYMNHWMGRGKYMALDTGLEIPTGQSGMSVKSESGARAST